MDTNNLIAWLPFDDSPTFDFYGNTITTYGNPTIADTNALTGNALQLDGSSYLKISDVTLGGKDFYIDCWVDIKLFSPNNARVLHIVNSSDYAIVTVRKNASDATKLDFWVNSTADVSRDNGYTHVSTINSVSSRVHVKLLYRYSTSRGLYLYINDQLAASRTGTSIQQFNRQTFDIYVGARSNGNQGLIGTIDELRIYDGNYLSSGYDTPPTVDEYIQQKINFLGYAPFILKADIKCKVKNVDKTWRYYNVGNTDTLIVSGTTLTDEPESTSVTGTAFYQTAQAACFPIPATREVWMKFDLYHRSTSRFWAGNRNANGYTGIISWQTSEIDFWERDNKLLIFPDVMKTYTRQTWLLHMKSGVTDGILELWCDENKVGEYTGNVNNGDDFADLFLSTTTSAGTDNLFSNVVISNEEIYFGEGHYALSFDVRVIDPIIVPAIGEHFNHLVYDTYTFSNGIRNIILPKRSKVYLRWNSYRETLKIFSDTDATGKIVNNSYSNVANMYAVLDECEKVFIEASPLTTPQYVIKEFMSYLLYDGLDTAINTCTGGQIADITMLTSNFLRDLNASASYTDFLRDYCDIILDNADTGAMTGLDAGGGVEKTAESVVPEKTSPADWEMPTAGSTTIIIDWFRFYELTVYWPTRGATGSFTDAEKFILAGLNSEWIARSLELIYDTYELGFNPYQINLREIDVNFERTSDNVLAHVTYAYNSSETTKISLYINMRYYEQIGTDSEDGDSLALGAIYLDRTLAHEFVHALMAVYLGGSRMANLPVYIREGTAELVHGVDDERRSAIVELLTTRTSDLETFFSTGGSSDNGNNDPYAAGYMLLRYLAKQGQYSKEDYSGITISNLLISDGATSCEGADSPYEALTDNTRQIIPADVSRTVVKSIEDIFDVNFFYVVSVELFADLRRTIITKLSLFPVDNSQYFSGGGSTPVTLPSQEVIPSAVGNTSGLQSIEITLAEQQLTDQVTVTGVIPFDIMGGVSGTYLDYDYDMCVEGVTQQGALYTADCCSGVDELLYTQINYSLSSGFTYFAPDYKSMSLAVITTPLSGDEVIPNIVRKGKASAHLKQIADALDKDCECQFEDFVSEINTKQEDVTYNDIISQLFGWTSRLPQRMINVFIRDNTLFAVQRGQEKKTIDITGANYPYPTIEKKLMRTMWGSGKFGITPQTKEETVDTRQLIGGVRVYPWPPTTSADGKTKYIYENVTGYAGVDGIGYALLQTETENDDGGKTTVTYIYDIVNGVYTCTAEESKTYDGEGEKVEEHKIIHDRLTRSQEFSRMEDEDGNTVTSNVSSNLPGFYNESYVLQKPYEIGSENTYQMISGYNRLVDSNFPVCDPDIYPKLIEAYAWLNRKTQETVKLDIYNYPHLIDFNDKIVLNGNEYFLVSNTAITTPHIFNRQSISIVRWY